MFTHCAVIVTSLFSQLITPAIEQPIANVITAISSYATLHIMDLSDKQRGWYFNPDGSCVQLSIGMAGVHVGDLNAATLPFNSAFGLQERGGSWPGRTAAYCNKRHIMADNITGDSTIKWIEYAAETNRMAAIGLGAAHFQTLYGWDKATDTFYVCNNQTPGRIDKYTRAELLQKHEASGKWVVVLRKTTSRNPVLRAWWK